MNEIPVEVTSRARQALLDYVGVTLAVCRKQEDKLKSMLSLDSFISFLIIMTGSKGGIFSVLVLTSIKYINNTLQIIEIW